MDKVTEIEMNKPKKNHSLDKKWQGKETNHTERGAKAKQQRKRKKFRKS